MAGQAKIGIIMGSLSDWPTMKCAADVLDELGVAYEAKVVSAHRTPKRLYEYAETAKARGLKVIIAGAGGAAHLPGMTAAMTQLPVLGVPIASKALSGQDSLLSIVQMPAGVPVGTLAIGEPGATNAGLLAAQILALADDDLAKRLEASARQADGVRSRGAEGRCLRIPAARPLPPGSTIGILGSGQLGRMLAMAAARLGLKTHIYCADSGPAFDVATRTTKAAFDDLAALVDIRRQRRCGHLRVRERGRRDRPPPRRPGAGAAERQGAGGGAGPAGRRSNSSPGSAFRSPPSAPSTARPTSAPRWPPSRDRPS